MEYDGIVLESWSRWAAYGVLHDPDMRKMVFCVLYNSLDPLIYVLQASILMVP